MKTAILLLLFLANAARADQCGWNDSDMNKAARALLSLNSNMVSFCQPCGDVTPVEQPVPNLGNDDNELLGSDGGTLDFAYTYVKIASDLWGNLGLLTNCQKVCDSASGICAVTDMGVSSYLTEVDGRLIPGPIQ